MILFFFAFFLLASCANLSGNNHEINLLNKRLTLLEQRIDSLIAGRNTTSLKLNNGNNLNAYSELSESGRCQAFTKKGTQCKRKARNSTYCWQHGG